MNEEHMRGLGVEQLVEKFVCLPQTAFADWLAPIHLASPCAGIDRLAKTFDTLTFRQWVEVGDMVADWTASLRYEMVQDAVKLQIGETWSATEPIVQEQAHKFAVAACGLEELRIELFHWRIGNIGLAVMGAVGESILAKRKSHTQTSPARWFLDVFSLAIDLPVLDGADNYNYSDS
jgi:hypothetical protein